MSGLGAACWLTALAALVASLDGSRPAAGRPAREALSLSPVSESAPVRRVDGQPYVGVHDLARLLDARRAWRGDLRRLTLIAGGHRIELILDNPFAVIDSSLVRLPTPARSVRGEMLIPAAFVDTLPRDPELARLLYDPLREAVVVLPPGGVVRAFRFTAGDSLTRLVFTADRPDEATVADGSRDHFRLRFSGYFAGRLPDVPPPGSLVGVPRAIGTASGCAFELTMAPEASGFRLVRDPAGRLVTLEITRAPGPDFEPLAPQAMALPPGTPVVVLDPGHGGPDHGVEAGGFTEKQLTLALARLLRDELEHRRIARVLLTRDDDREVPERERAEAANHARAALYLSLHFDGFPAARSRGVTAWCPPARSPAVISAGSPGRAAGSRGGRRHARAPRSGAPAGTLTLLPWHEAALLHADRSRALAEAVRSALVLRDLGPVRVREFLSEPLIGVDAPGLLLECGTLTSPADLERLRRADGLRALAATLADAIGAWRRSE